MAKGLLRATSFFFRDLILHPHRHDSSVAALKEIDPRLMQQGRACCGTRLYLWGARELRVVDGWRAKLGGMTLDDPPWPFLFVRAPGCFAVVRFALAVLGVQVVIVGQGGQPEACRLNGGDHIATMALAAMSILFGLFTCCMACDQCHAASTNQTKIDRWVAEAEIR